MNKLSIDSEVFMNRGGLEKMLDTRRLRAEQVASKKQIDSIIKEAEKVDDDIPNIIKKAKNGFNKKELNSLSKQVSSGVSDFINKIQKERIKKQKAAKREEEQAEAIHEKFIGADIPGNKLIQLILKQKDLALQNAKSKLEREKMELALQANTLKRLDAVETGIAPIVEEQGSSLIEQERQRKALDLLNAKKKSENIKKDIEEAMTKIEAMRKKMYGDVRPIATKQEIMNTAIPRRPKKSPTKRKTALKPIARKPGWFRQIIRHSDASRKGHAKKRASRIKKTTRRIKRGKKKSKKK